MPFRVHLGRRNLHGTENCDGESRIQKCNAPYQEVKKNDNKVIKIEKKTKRSFLEESETPVNTLSLSIFLGLAYLLTVAIGIWLSQKGKPYHAALFNIHKLLALVGVVLVGVHISNQYKSGEFPPAMTLAVATLAFLVIVLFVTGALMSLEKLNYKILHLLHQIVPTLLILVGLWLVYLL